MESPIRILIADDHAVVREGLRTLITRSGGMELVGEAGNGSEAIALARSLNPDVILLDIVMPGKDGLQAISEIKQDNPEARILILTSFDDDEKVFNAVKSGALGYLLKDSAPEELLQAIRDVYQGQPSLSPAMAFKMVYDLKNETEASPLVNPLSAREQETLKLIAMGLTNQEIAERLLISDRTVAKHVSNILNKLHLANRVQAARYALERGLTDLDTPDQA